jgi:hypothetical protein
MVMKVDTDFLFATGAPAGLLHDSWNVRLIPHYSLAVWALFIHLGCGLRGVLLSHHTSVSVANVSAWGMVCLGAVIAATIILSMCRLHMHRRVSLSDCEFANWSRAPLTSIARRAKM